MKRTLLIGAAVMILVFGVVAYASAAGQSVTVNANVQPRLSLTIVNGDETATLAGLPGAGVVSDTSSMVVRSNVAYDITRAGTGALSTAYGTAFSATGATGTNFPKAPGAAGATHVETYSLDLGAVGDTWLDEGSVSEVFTYSVVQFF